MTTKNNNSYYTRLVKDLAVTFNNAPLSALDIARYWKRSQRDIKRVANELYKEGILTFNKKEEMVLTPEYKKLFRKNPVLALQAVSGT